MDLFSNQASNKNKNLLPFDGEVYHLGKLYSLLEAKRTFQTLNELIAWRADEVLMAGKHLQTKRKTAWFGDQKYTYTYSGIQRTSRIWIPPLLTIKSAVEATCQLSFNSCLLNLYHNGQEGCLGMPTMKKN